MHSFSKHWDWIGWEQDLAPGLELDLAPGLELDLPPGLELGNPCSKS